MAADDAGVFASLESRIVDLIGSRIDQIRSAVEDNSGNWAMRGFVDVWRNVLPMTPDTKVVSKVLELLLIPVFLEAIKGLPLRVEFAAHQNHYPDMSIVDEKTGAAVAVDLKSTYYLDEKRVNGFTLGAFTGYFRDRSSVKNVTRPYGSYQAHLVLGVLYEKLAGSSEVQRFKIDDIESVLPVAGDFRFLIRPKWSIATDRHGSGNTKNIGSITDIESLMSGNGPFTRFAEPEDVFDDYWMHYLTRDMARAGETSQPYTNLEEYVRFKQAPAMVAEGVNRKPKKRSIGF